MKHSDKKDTYHQGDQIVICPTWTTENTDFTNPLKSTLFKDLRRHGAFAPPFAALKREGWHFACPLANFPLQFLTFSTAIK